MSQVLTLYTTPVVYLYLENIRVRFNRRRGHTVADEVVPAGADVGCGNPGAALIASVLASPPRAT